MKKKSVGIKLGKNNGNRCRIFQIFVVFIFALLGSRLIYLQVIKGDKYKNLSEKNRVKLKRIEAPRGKIFDSYGELLATNQAGYRLVYLKERKFDEEILEKISELTNFDKGYVEKRIKYGEIFPYTRENVLVEDLDEKDAHRIMERLSDYPYLQVQTYSKREYVYDSLASHILGYVKKISAQEYDKLKESGYTQRDVVGKNGVEKEYDLQLQGKSGYEYIEVNALNRIVKKLKTREAEQGKDIYLTIDMRLQKYMEDYFKTNKLQGSAIAMDPKTGEIITMVSYPTYSLNMFSSRISSENWDKLTRDRRKPLNDRAITGEYPPGSIFKIITSIALLENDLNPDETMYDPGYYQIGKWKWKSWKQGGHGFVNLKKALVESVNTYFYKLGDEMGYEPIIKTARDFGLGEITGIDLPGEKSGRVADEAWKKKNLKEGWYRGDTVNLSIGQGYLTVTPLQAAVAYSVLANHGYAYKPHVMKYLENSEGREDILKEKYIEMDIPNRYFNILNKDLIATVEEEKGTAKAVKTEGIKIAAKTGSAQNSQYKKTHAWIAGYFPATDEPEVVFVVFVEGGGGGGSIAGPAAKALVDKYLELKGKG
jgi:penicillin-binding protein 2